LLSRIICTPSFIIAPIPRKSRDYNFKNRGIFNPQRAAAKPLFLFCSVTIILYIRDECNIKSVILLTKSVKEKNLVIDDFARLKKEDQPCLIIFFAFAFHQGLCFFIFQAAIAKDRHGFP
jgi:hypothetical protein